jgi:hypothetical protein
MDKTPFQTNLLYPPTKFFPYKKGYKRRYGLELELEGAGFPPPPDGWTDHPDGSLRNGVEYVLSSPHDFSGLGNRIKALNDALKSNGTIINNSYRAGTHIHVNIQNELYCTILGLIILEAIIEPVLLRLCGDTRNGSYFCLPTYDTGELPLNFENLLQEIETGMAPQPRRGKYACLNTDPISSFGTLEFRCFPASHDADQIMTWVGWVENMLTLVKDQSDMTFWDLYLSFKHNGEELLRRIFPDVNLGLACAPQTTRELLDLGLETGYELVRMLRLKYNAKTEAPKKKVGDWDTAWVEAPIPQLGNIEINRMVNVRAGLRRP